MQGNPVVKIGELGRRNNYAQIVIRGQVATDVRYYKSPARKGGGSLEFDVDDGTGILKIRCYDDATAELIREMKVPALGDSVEVRATYQFKARSDFAILGSAHSIKIERALAKEFTPISAINRNMEGKPVKIQGTVKSADFGRFTFDMLIEDSDGKRIRASIPISSLEMFDLLAEDWSGWRGMPETGSKVIIDGLVIYQRYAGETIVSVSLPHYIKKQGGEE